MDGTSPHGTSVELFMVIGRENEATQVADISKYPIQINNTLCYAHFSKPPEVIATIPRSWEDIVLEKQASCALGMKPPRLVVKSWSIISVNKAAISHTNYLNFLCHGNSLICVGWSPHICEEIGHKPGCSRTSPLPTSRDRTRVIVIP